MRETCITRCAGLGRAARRCSSGVEQLTCNQQVVGSTPTIGSRSRDARAAFGEVPEWPKGADCKSAGVSLRRFESSPLHMNCGDHHVTIIDAGIAQLARASAFQAEGRGFESRFPLHIYSTDIENATLTEIANRKNCNLCELCEKSRPDCRNICTHHLRHKRAILKDFRI